MMIKWFSNSLLLLNLFTAVTFNVAWGEGQSSEDTKAPFSTELGFKQLTDSATPDFLKVASKSVFEIRMYAEESPSGLKTIDLTDAKFNGLEEKIKAFPGRDEGGFDTKEKQLILRQIQNCRTKGNEKTCTLFFTIEKATGFIAGKDGSSFWTNAHVINRYLKLLSALQGKSVPEILKENPRLPLFIFDQDGKLVFDAITDQAVLTNYDNPSSAALIQNAWYAEDTDFVEIKLSRSIGNPLPIGRKPKTGDLLFRPGYSACTGCSSNPNTTDPLDNVDRGSGKNATGEGLWWSAGILQSLEAASRYFDLNQNYWNSYKSQQMIFFSADAQVGFSGSPILNVKGEVIGIFAGSKPKMYGKAMLNLSRGVRPTSFDLN